MPQQLLVQLTFPAFPAQVVFLKGGICFLYTHINPLGGGSAGSTANSERDTGLLQFVTKTVVNPGGSRIQELPGQGG